MCIVLFNLANKNNFAEYETCLSSARFLRSGAAGTNFPLPPSLPLGDAHNGVLLLLLLLLLPEPRGVVDLPDQHHEGRLHAVVCPGRGLLTEVGISRHETGFHTNFSP